MPNGRKFMIYLNSVKNNIISIQEKVRKGRSLSIKDTEFIEEQYRIYRDRHEV